MKVYILEIKVDYGIYENCGVFSSEEKAKKHIELNKISSEYYVSEFEIDEFHYPFDC